MSADQNPWGARRFVLNGELGMGFGKPERPVVANVPMNPRSLWTPVLWEWGSITRSCTVCTSTLNLQWRLPHSSTQEEVYGDPRSTGMSFLGLADTEERPTQKRLQFELQPWRSISHFEIDTDSDTFTTTQASATVALAIGHCVYKRHYDLPPHMSCKRQHCHEEASSISISKQTHLRIRLHSLAHSSSHYHTTGQEHLYSNRKLWSSASWVMRMSTSPWWCIYNFDTDSTTHDWDRETPYTKERRSSLLDHNLQWST